MTEDIVTSYESRRVNVLRLRERQRWIDLGYEPQEANYRAKKAIEDRVLMATLADATYVEIAHRLGISAERVRQMAKSAERRQIHASERARRFGHPNGLVEASGELPPSEVAPLTAFFDGTMQRRAYDHDPR